MLQKTKKNLIGKRENVTTNEKRPKMVKTKTLE